MTMEQTKTCTKCGEQKVLCEFFRDASRSDGLTGRCKPCHRADAKRYRDKESFKKKAAERSARYREIHPDRVAIANFRDRDKNAERLRKWRDGNNEKVRAQSIRRRPKQLAYYKDQADRVSDYYVVHSLHLPIEVAPLIRAQIKIKRATKQLLSVIKEKHK